MLCFKYVITGSVTSPGWGGLDYTRLDFKKTDSQAPASPYHLYLPPTDPVALLPSGTVIMMKFAPPASGKGKKK